MKNSREPFARLYRSPIEAEHRLDNWDRKGMEMRKFWRKRVGLGAIVVALAAAGSATAAFQGLPPGQQVNNDPAAGINPNQPVNTADDPANSDVVGGSLVATKPLVPWAIFRQTESSGKDQIFSRSFAAGAWTTRGNGTVFGRSSTSPTFSGSLNFDQGQNGEAPSIDFAGASRTVPWASWYEHTTGTNFGADNIFASRFDNISGDPNQGKWIFAGQGRGNGGSGPDVPSLNIHTNRDAVNPVVQGGSAKAGNDPVPWVTWQELDGGSTEPNQIFTSRAVKPTSAPTCPNDGANPIKPSTATGSNNGFCFQQIGIDRLAPNAGAFPPTISDPSMNVDPSRDGIEPDMAFTGPNDTVPWVVWYETAPERRRPQGKRDGVRRQGDQQYHHGGRRVPVDGGRHQWRRIARHDRDDAVRKQALGKLCDLTDGRGELLGQ